MALALDAFFSPPDTVSGWLLGMAHPTQQPRPAGRPHQLSQGSGAAQLWERRGCAHAYQHASTAGNHRKPLPSEGKLSSSCMTRANTSGLCAIHLSTEVYPEGARKGRPWFFYSPFWSLTMTRDPATSSA